MNVCCTALCVCICVKWLQMYGMKVLVADYVWYEWILLLKQTQQYRKT
jgi:hypothetical protein